MTANPYKPGDRLRVTVNEAYNSELSIGDLVTVDEVGIKHEHDGTEIPVVYVASSYGIRVLGLDAVEPANLPGYKPAEPDEIIDAQFRAMMEAHKDLATLATDADTALGAVDDEVGPRLSGDDSGDDGEAQAPNFGPWSDPTPGDVITVRDAYGDTLTIVYAERTCENHGREGALFFSINDDSEVVVVPINQVDPLIRFLYGRRMHAKRADGPDALPE